MIKYDLNNRLKELRISKDELLEEKGKEPVEKTIEKLATYVEGYNKLQQSQKYRTQFSKKARSVDGRILSFLRSRRRTKIFT